MNLVSIDPGSNKMGVAAFWGSTLAHAHLVSFAKGLSVEDRSVQALCQIKALPAATWGPKHIVCEGMHTYPGSPPANDLIQVEGFGRIAFSALYQPGDSFRSAWASTWKGSLNKDLVCPLIFERLSATERAVLPRKGRQRKGEPPRPPDTWEDVDDNVLEAVGIGLWQLKQFGKRGWL